MLLIRRHAMLAALLGGILWTLLVAWVDVRSGFQLKLGPCFLLPVLWIAWYGGVRAGVSSALAIAAAWRGLELYHLGSAQGWVQFWDLLIHAASFVSVALFVGWASSLVRREKALVHDLSVLLAEVRQLEGLLPICAWCKKVRNDQGYWQQIEAYVSQHSKADWTHGICPECMEGMVTSDEGPAVSAAIPPKKDPGIQ